MNHGSQKINTLHHFVYIEVNPFSISFKNARPFFRLPLASTHTTLKLLSLGHQQRTLNSKGTFQSFFGLTSRQHFILLTILSSKYAALFLISREPQTPACLQLQWLLLQSFFRFDIFSFISFLFYQLMSCMILTNSSTKLIVKTQPLILPLVFSPYCYRCLL